MTMKKPLYLVITDISKLGCGYTLHRTETKAIKAARDSAKTFARSRPVRETDLPLRDPTCLLDLEFGCDGDDSVQVISVYLD
jgi:hypothetical protein